jgi:hypothetical protein
VDVGIEVEVGITVDEDVWIEVEVMEVVAVVQDVTNSDAIRRQVSAIQITPLFIDSPLIFRRF